MTQQELVDGFTAWAAFHGVVAKPVNDERWEASPANPNNPGVQMTYTSPSLTRLRLPADVMLWSLGPTLDVVDDKRMEMYLFQVLSLYGLSQTIKVTWREFLNPTPKVPAVPTAGPVGDEVPRASVDTQAAFGGRIDATQRYFYVNGAAADGQRLEDDGKRYVAVKPGPFSIWWMLIG